MRSLRAIFLLCGLVVFAQIQPVAAQAPPDPLRLVPSEADVFIQVPQVRGLIDSYTTLDWVQKLEQFPEVRALYDSTNARRFRQLVAYFERQLGTKWPEAVDRLAGGGAVVALKFGPDPAPALFVLQASDEDLLRKFMKIGVEMLEQELTRQESKEKVERGAYRGIETFRIGKDFHAAVAGKALILSNKAEVLQKSLDLQADGPAKSLAPVRAVAEARKSLPANPLAWLWLNLDVAHKAPQAKDVFAQPRNDANLTVLAGGFLDVLRRAPYVTAALARNSDGFLLSLRVPAGREGMPVEWSVHVPLDAPPPLPLLEPKGVLYSSSYHFDISKFWEHRGKLFNEKSAKEFEAFDQKSAAFLLGNRFSKLVGQIGSRQRLVVVNPASANKADADTVRAPAFALVLDLREPETFGRSMGALLRAAAFLASTQVKLKLVEEKLGEHNIVGYRFADDATIKGDADGNAQRYIRDNFSPSFVRVGDQFVMSSTIELSRELVGLLEKEAKGTAATPADVEGKLAVSRQERTKLRGQVKELLDKMAAAKTNKERAREARDLQAKLQAFLKLDEEVEKLESAGKPPDAKVDKSMAGRSKLYAAGGVELLRANEDQLLVQTILNQAIAPEEARKQVEKIVELVRQLGVLQFEVHYAEKEFRFEARLKMVK